MSGKPLSSIQKDALKEIGNIGAGNATTSLSALVDKKIQMEVPSVKVVSFDEMMDVIGGSDQTVVGLYFRITGDTPGAVYFILTIKEAQALLAKILPDTHVDLLHEGTPNEYALSALKEVGNIVTGSYLSALSDFMSLNMSYSIPYLSVDMVGAIITVGLLEICEKTDNAIIINTNIGDEEDHHIHGQFILLPDPEAFYTIFSSLGIQTNEA
ncbi:MAG TPA: chemotaxis protein CheC [Bacillota bacterium]|nr:chemotaxis protein CheC [Bacillota bacterium]